MKRLQLLLLALLVAGWGLAGCDNGAATTTPVPPTPTVGQVVPTSAPGATATAGPPVLRPVKFAMDWTPNTNHTGIYVALQKGWYAEQGLDVQLLPYSDAITPDTLVGTGQAAFGISFEEQVLADRVNGLPIISVAAVLQTNTSALVTLKGSGLDRPAQLEGKRYAGFGATFEEPVITTVLKSDGAAQGTFQNITTNLFGYQALVAKQADFLWLYEGWDGVQARLDKVELNTFLLKDHGVPDYYTPVIIANQGYMADSPFAAQVFMAATARGYEFAADHPAEAADLLIAAAPPGTFPSPDLPRQSAAYLAPFYKNTAGHWGVQTLDYWTNFPRYLAATGLLKAGDGRVITPTDIDYAGLFTNNLLPK